ncbi:hypothetical protein I79_024194 [Cricetulus griseus]|uniref:Uncharacterized protein n=1 Tax=Cricetulus griseus TaxID=10029 RepID=G3IK02_CRIGR|nr:hypothetical protein I79_024194 [Cricetulus griseus]
MKTKGKCPNIWSIKAAFSLIATFLVLYLTSELVTRCRGEQQDHSQADLWLLKIPIV